MTNPSFGARLDRRSRSVPAGEPARDLVAVPVVIDSDDSWQDPDRLDQSGARNPAPATGEGPSYAETSSEPIAFDSVLDRAF